MAKRGQAKATEAQIFIRHLIEANFNASEAVRRMDRESRATRSVEGVRSRAYHFMKSPEVAALYRTQADLAAMSAEEVLWRLAEQARVTVDDFLGEDGTFDLERARERGVMHLLKGVTVRTTKSHDEDGEVEVEVTDTRIELHDAQRALALLAKHHQLLTEFKSKRDDLPRDRASLEAYILREIARIQGVRTDIPTKES